MIFYFTGTGNSLYAARQMQARLGGKLLSIPELIRRGEYRFTAAPGEYVGFVFPVYYLGLPAILHRFVSRLVLEGATPARTFLLATMGKTSGTSCKVLAQALISRGIRAGYGFSVPMPDNSLFTMPTEEEAHRQLDVADVELQKAAEIVLSGKRGDYDLHKGPLAELVSPLIYLAYRRKTKPFRADNRCTGCGICQRVCPVGAIRVIGGAPKWVKEHCEFCLAVCIAARRMRFITDGTSP